MKKKKVSIIILCLMSLMVLFSTIKVNAYNYAITSNYTVNCKNNVFTIKRDKVDTSESVFYRTVNKSAVESEHFTRTMGRLDFDVNEDKKTVTVEETAVNDVPIVSRYQTTDRVYGFEVYTADNTVLASCNRTIEYGSAYKFNTQAPTSYNGSYAIYHYSYNRSYNGWDYVYNNNGVDWHYISEDNPNTAYSYYNGLKIYYPSLKTINDKRYYTTITDSGYGQKVYSISLSQLFDCYGVNQEYVAATGVSIFARGFFDIAEIDDGYQYVQVLLDNESTYDSGAKDGDPGKVATSMYMAGFTHYDKGVKPSYATYCVPCRNMNEEPYTGDSVCTMLTQKFNPSYPVATTGESDDYWKIPASTSNIVFRFDASGSGDDDYKVSNLGVELHFVDETRPYVTKVITQVGTYHKGESMTIALKFNEIIHSTSGIGVLHTNVGDFSYSGGVGTNILYFTGYITAEKATSITINSVDSFNYKDLLGFFADESSVIGRGTQVNIDYYQTPGIINGAYQITTRGDLLGFLNIVNGTGGKSRNISANAALKNDIKIENFLWTSADIYAGTFDGEGHTITFRVKEVAQDSLGTASGMFTRTLAGSRITNLILSSTISDSKFTGLCNENNGTIDRIKIDIAKYKNYYGSITSPIVCTNKGTITLCVVNDGEFMCTGGDFKSGGICGKNEGTISNCYSMGINVGYSVYKSNIASICLINDGTISNCYTIKNHFGVYTEESHFVLTDNTGTVTPCVVTDEDAKSGKLCYLLNEGVTDGTQAWYQTLSTNMYPVWDNSYETVYCDLDVYSNYPGHNMHYVALAASDGTNPGHIAYYECSLCHRMYSDQSGEHEIEGNDITILNPIFIAHSITIADYIGVRFKVVVTQDVDIDSAYMIFTSENGRTARQDLVDATLASDYIYWFTFKINPLELFDEVTATFYYGDNRTVVNNYRPSDYSTSDAGAQNVFDKLKDFSYYLAQTSWTDGLTHHAPDLPSTTYTESDVASYVDCYELSHAFSGGTDMFTGYSVSLSINTTITINFSAKIKSYFEITSCNYEYEIEERADGRYIKIQIRNLKLTDAFTNQKLEIRSDTFEVTVNVSVLGYVKKALKTDGFNVNKKKALYAYYKLFRASRDYGA